MTPSTCRGMGSSASTASTSRPLAASSATEANVWASGQSAWRWARRSSLGSTRATTSTSGLST